MKQTLEDFSRAWDASQLRKARTPHMAFPVAASIVREPYAWPGGYERIGVTEDGGLLCDDCIRKAYRDMIEGYDSPVIAETLDIYVTNDGETANCETCCKTWEPVA